MLSDESIINSVQTKHQADMTRQALLFLFCMDK